MLPVGLEQLVLQGKAKSKSHTFGGSAISSLGIEDGKQIIIWNVQIFPFIDLDTETLIDPVLLDIAGKIRTAHYYEFDTGTDRYGLVHRCSFRLENSLVIVPPNPLAFRYPVPLDPPANMPVYWGFVMGAKVLTCRVTCIPPVSQVAAIVTANPTTNEGSYPGGYGPATTIVNRIPMQNPVLEAWKPDLLSAAAPPSVKTTGKPRPSGIGAPTVLGIPSQTAELQASYGYPLVNISYIELEKQVIS